MIFFSQGKKGKRGFYFLFEGRDIGLWCLVNTYLSYDRYLKTRNKITIFSGLDHEPFFFFPLHFFLPASSAPRWAGAMYNTIHACTKYLYISPS